MITTELDLPSIYSICCKVTGFIYVGSTKTLRQRIKYHKSQLTRNCHHSKLMQRDFNKYGEESFSLSVLWICPIESLKTNEQVFLDRLGVGIKNKSYNSRKDASEGPNYKDPSIEASKNRSAAQKKKFEDPEFVAKLGASLSKALKGRVFSAEHKQNLSKARKGKSNPEQAVRRSKKILVTTPEGIQMCYFSVKSCCEHFNLIPSCVQNCAKGMKGRHTYKGYKFLYL